MRYLPCSLVVSLGLVPVAFGKSDLYANFAELAQQNHEGIDYQINLRSAPASASAPSTGILAIHGGRIEPGTSSIAKAIAGPELPYYLFEGIRASGNTRLHITSDHFDEPRGLAFVKSVGPCVSIHGYADSAQAAVCVGGDNVTLAQAIVASLKARLPELKVDFPCASFEGIGETNIVNRCQQKGVQLELSRKFRDELEGDQEGRLTRFAAAVRAGLPPHP